MIDSNIANAINGFKSGKIGIFPTDTAYGIGCRMDDADAVKRVFKLRNRSVDKALLVLVSSLKMAEKYVYLDEKVRKQLVDKFWPGGLTIIAKCYKDKVPEIVRANGDTLAVRLIDHKQLVEVIEKVGVPIVAPSANYSGEKTPLSLLEVDHNLRSRVDFVLDGVCTIKGVSTIVDASVNPWKIVRQGVVHLNFNG